MKITLRRVEMNDADMLLAWKNDDDTRKNSILTDAVIKRNDHLVWLLNALKDPTLYFMIVLLDGEPVGDVRIDKEEISIRIDKKYRGMGLATQVIGRFSGPLTAKIRVHNMASMRSFIANGYRPEKFVDGNAPYIIFKK